MPSEWGVGGGRGTGRPSPPAQKRSPFVAIARKIGFWEAGHSRGDKNKVMLIIYYIILLIIVVITIIEKN